MPRITTYLILTTIIFAITIVALLQFKINKVTCRYDDQQPCNQITQSQLDNLLGRSLFFTSVPQSLSKTTPQSVMLEIVTTTKTIGGEIHLVLQSEPAAYVLINKQTNEQLAAISSTGTSVTNIDPERQLPQVFIANPELALHQNQVIPSFHTTISTIIKSLPSEAVTIDYQDHTYIVIKKEDTPPLIIAEPVPVSSLQHLEEIMYTVEQTVTETPIKEIDLRFRLPVLRTES